MIRTVAIYARVSTQRQATEGASIDEQVRRLEALAGRKGWTVAGRYVDAGQSGRTTAGRAQFQAMIEAAGRREFGAILVTARDRWARNHLEGGAIEERLAGLGVLVIDEGSADMLDYVDADDPSVWLKGAQEDLYAAWFSRLQGKKVSKGIRGKAQRGLHVGDVPFGYQRPDPRAPMVPDPAEAPVVLALFERHATGAYSLAAEAFWLNTTGQHPHSKRGLTRFTKSSVKELLANPVYVGDITTKGELLPGLHPPIVSRALFEAVQSHRRSSGPRAPRGPERAYLLAGLARHGECGSRVWADGDHRYSAARFRYRCSGAQLGLASTCVKRSCDRDLLDAEISQVFAQLVLPPHWREYVAAEIEDRHRAAPADPDGSRRRALEARRSRIRRAILEEVVEFDEAAAAIRAVDAEIASLTPRALSVGAERAGEQLLSIHELWPAMTPEERAECVRIVLESVEVDLATGAVTSMVVRPDFEPLFASVADAGGGCVVMVRPGGAARPEPSQASRIYIPAWRAA